MAEENKEHLVIIEPWYKKIWRPVLAFTYITICLFDFMIMPAMMESFNERENNQQAVELALKFTDTAVQIKALEAFTEKRSWIPLTLGGGGFFHIAFGALLTGAAVTRGLSNRESIQNGKHPV